MRINPSSHRYPVKIYTVQITATPKHFKQRWYNNKMGENVHCVLVTKEVSDGFLMPVYMMVSVVEGEVRALPMVLTIRPEDCKVVDEFNVKCTTTMKEFIKYFCTYKNAA